jgi:hypothetical protein
LLADQVYLGIRVRLASCGSGIDDLPHGQKYLHLHTQANPASGESIQKSVRLLCQHYSPQSVWAGAGDERLYPVDQVGLSILPRPIGCLSATVHVPSPPTDFRFSHETSIAQDHAQDGCGSRYLGEASIADVLSTTRDKLHIPRRQYSV